MHFKLGHLSHHFLMFETSIVRIASGNVKNLLPGSFYFYFLPFLVHTKAAKQFILCVIRAHIVAPHFPKSQHNLLLITKKGTSCALQEDTGERSEVDWWDTIPKNDQRFKSLP